MDRSKLSPLSFLASGPMRVAVMAITAVAGCGEPAAVTVSPTAIPPHDYCFSVCNINVSAPTAPDDPWQADQFGYVVASQPLAGSPAVQVTLGLDDHLDSQPLWFRVSNAYQADGKTPSGNAESYKALSHTIQFQQFSNPDAPAHFIPATSTSCEQICLTTDITWSLALCQGFVPPNQVCQSQAYGCGTVSSPCLNAPYSCGTCAWFQECLGDHFCIDIGD
jgi:hypothetical protein